jgi:hypothetical protein
MKAPIDKLVAGGNRILQIEITTACTLNCSNCTRLLPYRSDVLHMTPNCFREAVQSVRDWPGIVAVFGGNPTSHAKFPELMEIYCEAITDQRRRGLWANDLLKHGELCRKVFYPHATTNLNAHADPKAAARFDEWLPGKMIESSRTRPAWHGSITVDRKDYGISDEAWIAARENCDINQHWSGIVVERAGKPFAYFCEVASALDGVRGQNHGIPVEPGWWRWRMDHFEGQVRNCCDRGCGVPLRLKGHLDHEEIYDASPSWAPVIGSSKRVAVETHEALPITDRPRALTDYLRLRSAR